MGWVNASVLAAALAAGAASTGFIRWSGLLAGALLAAILGARAGAIAIVALGALFFIGSLATRWRMSRSGGEAHEARGAAHALANAGPAALLVLCCDEPLAAAIALACLGGALADTLASELGLLAGEAPRLLLFGARVPPGTDGGMSWCGTAVSAAVAVMTSLAAQSAGLPRELAWLAAGGVFLAPLLDSVLGATVEARLPRAFGNHAVNGLATGMAGLLVLLYGMHG